MNTPPDKTKAAFTKSKVKYNRFFIYYTAGDVWALATALRCDPYTLLMVFVVFIRDFSRSFMSMSNAETSIATGITKNHVKWLAKLLELKKPSELRSRLAQSNSFSVEEDTYVIQYYLSVPIKRIAKDLGRGSTGVMGCLKRMGLTIPDYIIERNTRDGRFKPGVVPQNKGKKLHEFMSQEGIENSKKSRFKKGHIPNNTYDQDGIISIRNTKGRPYKYIRIAMGAWVPLHKQLWEKENGAVPSGHCLLAKDGDSLNVDLCNWELITRRENAIRNSGSVSLTQQCVAKYLSPKNTDLREVIKKHHPELIAIKRQQLLLAREINKK